MEIPRSEKIGTPSPIVFVACRLGTTAAMSDACRRRSPSTSLLDKAETETGTSWRLSVRF